MNIRWNECNLIFPYSYFLDLIHHKQQFSERKTIMLPCKLILIVNILILVKYGQSGCPTCQKSEITIPPCPKPDCGSIVIPPCPKQECPNNQCPPLPKIPKFECPKLECPSITCPKMICPTVGPTNTVNKCFDVECGSFQCPVVQCPKLECPTMNCPAVSIDSVEINVQSNINWVKWTLQGHLVYPNG